MIALLCIWLSLRLNIKYDISCPVFFPSDAPQVAVNMEGDAHSRGARFTATVLPRATAERPATAVRTPLKYRPLPAHTSNASCALIPSTLRVKDRSGDNRRENSYCFHVMFTKLHYLTTVLIKLSYSDNHFLIYGMQNQHASFSRFWHFEWNNNMHSYSDYVLMFIVLNHIQVPTLNCIH